MSESAATSAPLPAGATPDIETLVRAAQAEMTFDRSRSSNFFGPLVALLVAWLLWPAVDHRLVVAWVLLKTGITGLRVLVTRRFDRERSNPLRVLHWGRRFEAVLLADGCVFGLLGTLLLPQGDEVMTIVMVATLMGIAAIALVVLAMSQRATLALTMPLLLPAMLWQLAQGDRISTYVGLGMGVFLVLSVVEGRRAAEHARDLLRLRFRMDELAAQRQQALDLAQHSSEVKSQFLATMSHEMRTPLHGILGLVRLLRDDAAPPGRAQQLQTLQRTGEHLLGLINDVLDYSRLEGRHLRLQPQGVDLHALVAEAGELCRAAAAGKALAVRVEQALPQPCPVLADAARLRQVLLNLTGNAVKFTPAGAIVLRSARGEAGRFVIEVQDSGPGVPAADRERIFQPFEQLDGSFARQHGGTGLGLAIARELARAMGGDIACVDAPGGGALFRLTVPLAAATLPPPGPAAPPRPPAALAGPLRGRVLLAEDNPVNAIVAQTWLQRLGAEVVTAVDGEQAVLRATDEAFDLVLMDCQMPGIDGFEATARIRRHEQALGARRTPIVALTANALHGDRERSLAAGMDEHLAKPFDEAALQALLRRYLRP